MTKCFEKGFKKTDEGYNGIPPLVCGSYRSEQSATLMVRQF